MASSLRMLIFVAALEGSWEVVGEVADAMVGGGVGVGFEVEESGGSRGIFRRCGYGRSLELR
jgi:hypothetical protein